MVKDLSSTGPTPSSFSSGSLNQWNLASFEETWFSYSSILAIIFSLLNKHWLGPETCCSHCSPIVTVRLLGAHKHRVDIKIHGPGQPEILWQPVLPSLGYWLGTKQHFSFFFKMMQVQVHWLVLSCGYARPVGCNCVSEEPNKERSKYSRPLAIHDWTYSGTIDQQCTR